MGEVINSKKFTQGKKVNDIEVNKRRKRKQKVESSCLCGGGLRHEEGGTHFSL